MSHYQICVSGAASGNTVEASSHLAFAVGAAIARAKQTLITGATIGLPRHAAEGAKSEGGLSIGFSPAATLREHVHSYRLPTEEFDYINYTGMEYVGRDVHLVRSSDAVITVGGRMGSLHEFSTAIESNKVCAVLLGSGGLADFIPLLTERIHTPHKSEIIYDTDPERIVTRVVEALNKKYADFRTEIKDVNERPAAQRNG
ncbi:hypothetical protein JNJ66_01985 [Candidatus Saccharibacteria bacterium]|nr:hypothetical protein [Candidatus Saccharibacteria bacterium]